MALLDEVKVICGRLGALGLRDLLKRVTRDQLDIQQPSAAALRAELIKPLDFVDRSQPGFGDFSIDGKQAVTAGHPARSLLYHALASPGVTEDLAGFPTLQEIETVENFVFGVRPPTLAQLRARAGATGTKKLAVVLFAYEYRPAPATCARVQADLVFSRAGVARVGTREPFYDPRRRGFQAEVADDPFGIRVCPARYGAFLAVRTKGSSSSFVPMRPVDGDAKRDFWIPIHKLFDGPECISGLTLALTFSSFHYNDKIRRTRAVSLKLSNVPATPPLQFSDGIAELAAAPGSIRGLLVPVPHPRLVEPARIDGKLLTFPLPATNSTFAAFEPPSQDDAATGAEIRPAPAYVHARTKVANGVSIDVGDDPVHPNVLKTVSKGKYQALHYVDFTGDGRIDVSVPALTGTSGIVRRPVACYSLIAAPDFFPDAGQRELFETVPEAFWGVPPVPLCDTRLPANLQMPGNRFDPGDVTLTALVPLFGPPPSAVVRPQSIDASRHSCLPDDCAGVFAPGWDVSTDKKRINGRRVHHLAAYGLGSPFPEDVKLCAALSTFWPAAAPDTARSMSSNTGNPELRATVAPLTDEEIGQVGALPWNGVPGPRVITLDGQEFAECENFLHADYVREALEGRFSLRLTGRVSSAEYARRMRAMGLVYAIVGGDRNQRFVISFRRLNAGDAELQQAQIDASTVLGGVVYRVDLIRGGADTERPHPTNFRKRLLPIIDRRLYLVDSADRMVLQRQALQLRWSRATIPP